MNEYNPMENGQQQQQQFTMVNDARFNSAPPMVEDTRTYVPANDDKAARITSINDLRDYSRGSVVRLPDFADGQPFIARLRRPSMLILAKQGKIPNSLMAQASNLFSNGGRGMDTDDDEMMSNLYDICAVIAEASLIEPTFSEIEQSGMSLTDEQLMAIFQYSQLGVNALKNFRE